MAVTTQTNADLVKKFGKSAQDSGSTGVQVAMLTERINDLTAHFEKNPKDHSGKRGLMKMIGKRRSLLKYMQLKDEKGYGKLINDLGLRK